MWLYVYEYLILVVLMGKGPVACIDVLYVGRCSKQLLCYWSLAAWSAICVDIAELKFKSSKTRHMFTYTKHFKGRWLWCAITHTCFLPLVSIILSCRRHMACGTGMPTFMHGRVMSFFHGVTISLLKETILAGTATTEELMVVMKIRKVSTICTILYKHRVGAWRYNHMHY